MTDLEEIQKLRQELAAERLSAMRLAAKLRPLAEAAMTTSLDLCHRQLAASGLAVTVLREMPAPGPVAVPSPVEQTKESAC